MPSPILELPDLSLLTLPPTFSSSLTLSNPIPILGLYPLVPPNAMDILGTRDLWARAMLDIEVRGMFLRLDATRAVLDIDLL